MGEIADSIIDGMIGEGWLPRRRGRPLRCRECNAPCTWTQNQHGRYVLADIKTGKPHQCKKRAARLTKDLPDGI